MALTTIIAEKQLQAEQIAHSVLRSDMRRLKTHFEGTTLDGQEAVVVWAQGHLFDLAYPAAVDLKYKDWVEATLPIFLQPWPVEPISHTINLLRTICHFTPTSDRIINATDPDREGQLIFEDIYDYLTAREHLKPDVPVLRLWCRSLETRDLIASWQQLEPNQRFGALAAAARKRRLLDKAHGITGSRKLTIDARGRGFHDQLFTVGRVQTTALSFVVQRDRDRNAFVTVDYYDLGIFATLVSAPDHRIPGTWKPDSRFPGLDEDGRVVERITAEAVGESVRGLAGELVDVQREEKRSRPPLPHNADSLQAECWRRAGLTVARTAKAMDSLWQRAAITYPGTSSRHLPDSIIPQVNGILSTVRALMSDLTQVINATDVANARNVFVPEPDLVTSHHAIIPTQRSFPHGTSDWTDDERLVYSMIARTFVANLLPDRVTQHVRATLGIGGHTFLAKKSALEAPGWQAALVPGRERPVEPLPDLWNRMKRGDLVRCGNEKDDTVIMERRTNPPDLYDDATLGEAMAHAERYVIDERDREILRRTDGIGTPRTRSRIIELLIRRGFIIRVEGGLTSTGIGRYTIDSVSDALRRPELTVQAEILLRQLEDGVLAGEQFDERCREGLDDLLAGTRTSHRRGAPGSRTHQAPRKAGSAEPRIGARIARANGK